MYNYKFFEILQKYDKESTLFGNFDDFKLEFGENEYIVSLSGGVDSMVLLNILLSLNKKIIALHVNYNNREESKLEEEFLEIYCKERNITFECKNIDTKRGIINRTEYENFTKQIRFKFYQEALEKYNLKRIAIAHHKDDIIENIFSNFCKGSNFLNLSVLKKENIILGVNIYRPFLDLTKDKIYNYAHYHQIPYFLDTTPDWSVRGKFRRKILPELMNTFAGFKNNLLTISKQSEQWGDFINNNIINKYIESITTDPKEKLDSDDYFKVYLPLEGYNEYPFCFWYEVFTKVFHSYGFSAPSKSSIEILSNEIKTRSVTNLVLKNNKKIVLNKQNIIIYL